MRWTLLGFVVFAAGCAETKAISANGELDDVSIEDAGADADSDGGVDDGGDDDGGDDDGGDDGEAVSFELTFSLDREESIAGEAVTFEANWSGDDGSVTPVTDFELLSDLETDVVVGEASLTPTVAGEHTLTLTTTNDEGETEDATATLNVDAAAPATLSIVLSASEVVAGEVVTASVTSQDEFGNDTSGDALATLTGSDGVTVAGPNLLATAAGTHTAIATLGDIITEATWTVIAGPAASIDLILEDTDLESGDDTDYEVTTADEYGNPTSADFRIWADDGVVIDEEGTELTFLEDGVFNCHVEIEGTDITDTETVIIDSSGPELIVFTPERGDWGTETSTDLTGQAEDEISGVSSVTVNGAELSLSEDGSFASTLDLSFGINTFETVAADADFDEDGESNQTKDIRSVLQSDELVDPLSDIQEGIVVRMWEGEGGLGQLESMASGLMDSVDLDSLVEGELFSSSGCRWFFCWDVAVVGESISYDEVTMSIDATAAGTLDARVTIHDTEMLFQITGDTPFGWGDLPSDGSVTIDAIHVDVSLTPAIEDGALVFTDITYTVPEPEGIEVNIDDSLSGIISGAGLDMEEVISEQIVDGITAAMDGATDGLFDDALGSLDIEQDFEVSGMDYTLAASAHDVVVDEGGMTVSMQTRVTPDEVLSAGALDSVDGIPYYGFGAPTYEDGGSGTQMGLSTDVLNQMMFAFWQGGMLDQTLTDEALGLDSAVVGLLLPGVESINIVTTPLLPPVIFPTDDETAENQFELKIGSMLASIYDGEITEDARTIDLYVAATIPLTLSLDEDGSIAMTMGTADVLVDLAYMRPDLTASETGIEDLLGTILAGYLPELTGDLVSLPTPDIEAFAVTFTSSEMDGSGEPLGYWMLSGSLE